MTMPELMVAMAIFSLVAVGVIYLNLAGMQMNQLARSKMGASDEARNAISRMVTEIRGAGVVRIGNGDVNTFTEIVHGSPQRGNAIQIFPTKGVTNRFVRYFWDTTDRRLRRSENGAPATLIVANAITNQLVFTSEDFRGNVLTNNFNNRVIGVTLQFFQLQSPTVAIGPGGLFDFYQLRTRITRRALE